LDKLGFNSTTTILDVSDFGLPQKRLRTIILAWKHSQILHSLDLVQQQLLKIHKKDYYDCPFHF
jgi:site-specific DNA-cytosine methylase